MENLSSLFEKTKSILGQRKELLEKGLVEAEARELLHAFWTKEKGIPLSFGDLKKDLEPMFVEKVTSAAKRRIEGIPLHHVTGERVFLDHAYLVNSDVLIPRPETEVLVAEMISALEKTSPQKGMEVGLGSGVLSIELLSHFPELRMWASEVSSKAIQVAQDNAKRILPDPLRLQVLEEKEGAILSVFEGLSGFDFLVSNPPYLSPSDEIDPEVLESEPHEALFPKGQDSLIFYRVFAEKAASFLTTSGRLFLEIPHERSQEIETLFQEKGWKTQIFQDLTGRDRVLFAIRAESVRD